MRFDKHKFQVFQKTISIKKRPDFVWEVLLDINGWSRWNPLINHAVLYGPAQANIRFKCVSDKWEFDSTIIDVAPPRKLVVGGKAVGIYLELVWELVENNETTDVSLSASASGWVPRYFRKRVINRLEQDLDIWLSSLRIRLERPQDVKVLAPDDKEEEPERRSSSVFPSINLTIGSRKDRKGKRDRNWT